MKRREGKMKRPQMVTNKHKITRSIMGRMERRAVFIVCLIVFLIGAVDAAPCSIPNDTPIMFRGSKSVFMVKDCVRHEFPSADVFFSWGLDFSNVRSVSLEELNSLPVGARMESKAVPVSLPPNFESILRDMQREVSKLNFSCGSYGHEFMAHDYLSGLYSQYLKDYPVLIHQRCLSMHVFGNHLGAMLDQISCALDTGGHYLAIVHEAEALHSHHHFNEQKKRVEHLRQAAFLRSFPDLIINNISYSNAVVRSKVQTRCSCGKFCWADPAAPWTRHVPFIRELLQNAGRAFLAQDVDIHQQGTYFDHNRDVIIIPGVDSVGPNTSLPHLPLIPDTSVHYRCSDNLGYNYGALGYGVLPFRAIVKRIKASDKHIYILAEPAERTHPNPFCQEILYALQRTIHKHFPNAIVVLKRGDDQLLDYVRLMFSDVTICSTSTFCFFAGLATQGVAHFPLTNLIVQADPSTTNQTNAPNFGEHFKWIFETEAVFHFKSASQQLLDLLLVDT